MPPPTRLPSGFISFSPFFYTTELHRWGHPLHWLLTIACRTSSLIPSFTPALRQQRLNHQCYKNRCRNVTEYNKPPASCPRTQVVIRDVVLSSDPLLPVPSVKGRKQGFRRQITPSQLLYPLRRWYLKKNRCSSSAPCKSKLNTWSDT